MTDQSKLQEILALAKELIRIPSVTVGDGIQLDEVRRAGTFIERYLSQSGLTVRSFDSGDFPAYWAGFPGKVYAEVLFSGHFDVVAPDPDDSQFNPRVDGDFLWGRGAADMKTAVATLMVWMKDKMRSGPPFPPVSLLLIGNEEAGEVMPMGTPHVLDLLSREGESGSYTPRLLIAAERTGEHGDELWGQICTQNRGVAYFQIVARGHRSHSGVAANQESVDSSLLHAWNHIKSLGERFLTMESADDWRSQVRMPFIQLGSPGVYNITADHGVLGVEVRPIPDEDLDGFIEAAMAYCETNGLELQDLVVHPGVRCDPANPYLQILVEALRDVTGEEPIMGRKLPGTSARFAPGGQGIVWGQSGKGPHSSAERHFIPSILPYYRALDQFAARLLQKMS